MGKIILIGGVASGKTTLANRINGLSGVRTAKTQNIEYTEATIDTPGEYLEDKSFKYALIVASYDADIVVFVQDATDERFSFSPGQSAMFVQKVYGAVTKADIAEKGDIERASYMLELAGAEKVFCVSALTGEGMDDFLKVVGPAVKKGKSF